MKRRHKPHSLALKLFSSLALFTVLLLGGSLLLNSFVLPRYYYRQKEQALVEAFCEADKLSADGGMVELLKYLSATSAQRNVSITVWNGPLMLIYTDRPEGLRDRLEFDLPDFGQYTVAKAPDSSGNPMLRLVGRMNNGYIVSMRIPLSSIEDAIDISNRFLLISGSIILLVGVVAVLLLARSFVRPIQRLSELAHGVAQLDFSGRYTPEGTSELDALGNSINVMSDALSRTISDLQVANAQLTQDNLVQQQQNEARRAFIVNVSHELKTPIALVQNYAEGLSENIAADAAERALYCEVIEDEAQKMSGLIRKMMALMQLEDGSEQLTLEQFDLCELARNMLFKNEPEFARRHITVHPPEDTPVMVTADDYLMENVLSNYLSNALHHVPDGGEITVAFADAPEGRVRLSVCNTGSSIPPDDLPRIWESFYKVDKARTRAYGGSGIGLSLVAAIMKAHGMPYGVYNRTYPTADGEVCGVEFYIELPRAVSE